MNANNWPLDEMEAVVYDVPLSLEECRGRLMALDDPQQKRTRWNSNQKRTRVLEMQSSDHEGLYCVQRVPIHGLVTPMKVLAEMNVQLAETGTGTHLTFYITDAKTMAETWTKRSWMLVTLFLFLASLVFYFQIPLSGAICMTNVFVGLGLFMAFLLLHEYPVQQKILREKVWAAFDLDALKYIVKSRKP